MTRNKAAIVWVMVAIIAVVIFFVNPLADVAARFSHDVMIGSGALYGTLRIANSVMSIARDADVSGGVGVASVTASPGQLLQPVINTIERMVDLLFYLAIISGILSVVLVPLAKVAAAGLAVFALLCAALTVSMQRVPKLIDRLARSFLVLGLLGAILLPASYTVAFYAGGVITEEAWTNATEVFERMQGNSALAQVEQQVGAPKENLPSVDQQAGDGQLFGRLGSAFSGTLQSASDMAATVAANVAVINVGVAISNDLFNASIGIAVAYLVKLLVLPVLILAAFLYMLRSVIR
ncbi:hypothetical protein FE840_001200 [Peteryoungia desertarenae]|uniref:Uncharacterized protein n=1 Tax=Peteryoungia desertarenae TaxID=1813451 RepID=A0ABX6QJ68_9HYPH|nr:hypothetical protein [Peteryoungia desertarenae]QLF68280.1 hypothetical protein FE840_001200 [Peteryoungia desertarenae]